MSGALLRLLIRAAATSFQQARRIVWFFRRPRTKGVHGVVLTPDGAVVLVRLTYARGWRIPGGGRKKTEPPEEAMLRELREEIGLLSFAEIRHVRDFRQRPDFRRDESSLFLVTGARYGPRWSLEIEAVAEFDPKALPTEATAWTRRNVARALAADAG